MQASNPYEEIRSILVNNSFYPALAVRVKNKMKMIEGLQVDSPPVLKDEREKRLKEIVGDDYSVTWMGNGESNNHFLIKKKIAIV